MSRKTRKLMWSVPLIAAVAVIGALAAFMTLQQPNEAEAQHMEVPGMVQNLTVVAREAGTPQEELEVTWDPPAIDDGGPVTSYRIDVSEDGMRWLPYIEDHLESDLRIVYDGLMALETMHFRVFAFNSAGTGPGTSEMGTTTASTVPDRPDELMASDATALDADFGIDLDRDGDVNVPAARVINNLNEFDFQLDLEVDDGFVNETDVDDLVESGGPATTATGWAGSRQTVIQLTWEAPDDPPGAPVTSYRIEYSGERDGDRWTLLDDEAPCPANTGVDEGDCLYQHVGLRAATTNEYRIYANNSVGTGPVSDGATGKTAMSTAPDTISGVVIGLAPDSTALHLRWIAPMDPHGAHVTHYLVQAKLGTSDGTSTGDVVAAAEDAGYENLHSGVSIDRPRGSFETVIYNVGGDDLEDNAEIDIPKDSAGRYVIPALGLTVDVRIAAINRMNTDVEANDIPDASTGHDDNDGVWYEIENVPVGHEDNPRKPDEPDVKEDSDQHDGRSGLDIWWDAADFNEGKGPDDTAFGEGVEYILVINGTEQTASTIGGADTLNHVTAVATGAAETGESDWDKPWFNHDALRAELERTYILYALNSAVDDLTDDASIRSFPSNPEKETTADPLKPGAPRNLAVTADGHTEVKVTWQRPQVNDTGCVVEETPVLVDREDDGSECPAGSVMSVITGYKIEMSLTGTGNWEVLEANYKPGAADSDDNFTYSATGLQPDTRYYFRIAAVNSQGAGEPTTHESDDTDDPGMPTAPGGLVAQADGFDTLKICWYEQNIVDPLQGDAALDEGLPILGYKISYVMDDDSEMVLVENTMSAATQWMETGLLAGTTRTYRVRAITLGGVGSDYAEASATTDPADAPGMPTAVSASATSDTEITVTWSSPASNGGADITGYMVQSAYEMSDGTMSDWMDVDPAHTGMTMSYMDTGLMEMTKYYYRVAAMNAAGMGEYSDGMAMATTQAADTSLGPVTNVMASSDEAGTLTLTWEGGENADFYLLIAVDLASVGTDSLDYDRSRINDGMATTGDVTGLNSGSEYLGIVIALKSDGTFLHGTAGTITVD